MTKQQIFTEEVKTTNVTVSDVCCVLGWYAEDTWMNDTVQVAGTPESPQVWAIDSDTNDSYVWASGIDDFGGEEGIADFCQYIKEHIVIAELVGESLVKVFPDKQVLITDGNGNGKIFNPDHFGADNDETLSVIMEHVKDWLETSTTHA